MSLFIQAISVAPLQANSSQRRSRHSTDVLEFDAEASERLAQGSYVAAKMGLKATTFQTNGFESTNEPPCPTMISL